MTQTITHFPRTGSRIEKGAQERAALIAASLELVRLVNSAHESLCLGEPAQALGLIETAMGSRIELSNQLKKAVLAASNA